MPFRTPQYIGQKQGSQFIYQQAIIWEDDYMKEGQEMCKQYREDHAQQRYLEGWKKAWQEYLASQKEEV